MSSEKPPDHFGSIPIAEEDEVGQDAEVSPCPPAQAFVKPLTPGPKRPRRRVFWTIIVLAFLLTAYLAGGFFLMPYLLDTVLPSWAAKQNERPVAVGSASFNPLTLSATLRNGIVGPTRDELADHADPILSFALLKVNFSFLSLLTGDLVVQEFHCNDFFLHLVRRQDSTLNIASLFPAVRTDKIKPDFSWPSFLTSFNLRNITVENSEILYEDKKNNFTHRVEELRMALPYLSNQRKPQGPYEKIMAGLIQRAVGRDELIRPQFSAKVNGSPMTLSGETKIADDMVEAVLSIQLKSLDLADLWESLPQSIPAVLSKGSADLDLNLVFTSNRDSTPELRLTGNAVLMDLWFQDRQGKEMAVIPMAHLAGSGSPLNRTFHFTNLVLEKPSLHVERIPLGEWSLAGFFSSQNGDREKEQQNFVWSVDQLKISSGIVGIVDKTVPGGFSMSLTDIQGTMSSLGNNKPPETGRFAFTARLGDNGGLSVQGDLDQSTGETSGTLVLKSIDLAQFSPYLTANSSLTIKSGLLNSFESSFQRLPYQETAKSFVLSKAGLSVSNLALVNEEQAFLRGKEFSITKGEIDFSKHFLNLGQLSASQADLSMVWDKDDKLVWPAGTDEPKWQVFIQALEAGESQLRIVHDGLNEPFSFLFSNITLKAQNLSEGEKADNVSLTADLPGNGRITLQGSLSTRPLAGSLAAGIDSLSLPALQPFFSSWFVPEISSGSVVARGSLSLPDWSFNGSATLHNFLAKKENSKIMACQKVNIEDFRLGFSPFFFQSTNLLFEEPFLAWTVKAQEPGLNQFFYSDNVMSDSSAKKVKLRIDHLGFHNGVLEYRDETTTPPFSLMAANLQGSAAGVEQVSGSRAHFSLNGIVSKASGLGDESTTAGEMAAPVSISGSAGLFEPDIFFDLRAHFKDLSLVPLSPYLEPHLGYLVRRGNLEATISYFLENNMVKAENNLLVRRLKLGEPIADVTNLPLTIAILTDQQGVISLDIPVSGDKGDSSFTVRGALVKGIRNIFIRTMTSPFTLLASLFPDQPAPDTIHFAFGHSELTNESKAQLNNLAEILQKRPWLQISLKGFADSKGDIDALLALQKTEKLRRRLERERRLAEQIPAAYGKEEIVPLPGSVPMGEENIDEETIIIPEIGDKTLHRLARERSKSVRRYLTESQGIAPERLLENTKTSLVKEDNLGPSGNRVQFSLESLMP